jgi:5-methylcytosine-specific restriction endonuclease McrA
MQKYIKIYLDHFDFKDQSEVMCEVCMKPAADIHHVTYRSRGGKDEIKNLMALCRKHHDQAHNEILKEGELKLIHGYFMAGVRKIFKG